MTSSLVALDRLYYDTRDVISRKPFFPAIIGFPVIIRSKHSIYAQDRSPGVNGKLNPKNTKILYRVYQHFKSHICKYLAIRNDILYSFAFVRFQLIQYIPMTEKVNNHNNNYKNSNKNFQTLTIFGYIINFLFRKDTLIFNLLKNNDIMFFKPGKN